ncbi:MAG TPA: TlpA disulfide reductase family protein [Streptosporangiaceae bacterium]|nr:TlpA disulfide reductase family protein [Streptosporangiaceae bacterium]
MKRRSTILLVFAVIIVAFAVGIIHLTDSKAGLPEVGSVIPVAQRPMAPAISGQTLNGATVHVSSLRGAPVVINFWGSWCGPCQAEAPVLARVAGDTKRLGVRFVGIDIRDDPATGLAFERGHGIDYPSINDPNDLIAASFGADAPSTTPSTYILDSRGRIAWARFGPVQYGQLELALVRVAG